MRKSIAYFFVFLLISDVAKAATIDIPISPDGYLGGIDFSFYDSGQILPDPSTGISGFQPANRSFLGPYSEVTFTGINSSVYSNGVLIIETYSVIPSINSTVGDITTTEFINNTPYFGGIDLYGGIGSGGSLTFVVSPVPLPPSIGMFAVALGLVGLGAYRRRAAA